MRFAPLCVRLRSGKFREPDLLYLVDRDDPRRNNKFWVGADLVMEVVSDSPQDRERDLVTKRLEYAEAGIAESWIVDPESESITVLTLPAGAMSTRSTAFLGAARRRRRCC